MAPTVSAERQDMGGIAYIHLDSKQALVTCGASGTILFFQEDQTEIKRVEASCALNCLAASPKGDVFVVGDSQYVKAYKLPSGEFSSVATRFNLPVRAVAFSPSGSTLAAAGDDDTIKVINLANEKVIRAVRTTPYTRGLAYDPDSTFLASAAADGHLQVWDIATGKPVLSRKRSTPKIDVASPGRCGLAWHPDGGSLLAVAGTENDILCLERLSWDEAFVLKGPHTGPVNIIAFSPNGLYMASAGRDKKVVVWDLTTKALVCEQLGEEPLTALVWRPEGNCLAGLTETGAPSCWREPVPSHKPSPSAALDTLDLAAPIRGRSTGDEPDGEDGASPENSMDDFIEDDVNGDFTSGVAGNKASAASFNQVRGCLPQPQGPLQPGSTPRGGPGSRRWLVYTLLGCISSTEAEGFNAVEVTFHDTSRSRKRIPILNDFYRFHLASLSDKGALYASNASPDSPAMVVYRPFEAWAPNSDWSLPLPEGESPVAVAAARSLLALATSTQTLRLFSPAGTQTNVISWAGPVVAVAAQEHLLAVIASEAVALSPGARLTWLGFTPDGMLATFDSQGVLRLRTPDFGGGWMPAFDSAAEQKNKETFWPVAVTQQALSCVICREHTPVPTVTPRPTMSRIALHVPVLGAAEATGPVEDQQLLLSATLSHVREAAGRSAGCSGGGAAESDVVQAETEADKPLLRLFQAALKANRLLRAYELATRLHLMRSLEGSLKLANHHQVPALAERITAVIDARLALEAAEMALAEEAAPSTPPGQSADEDDAEVVVEGHASSPGHRLAAEGPPHSHRVPLSTSTTNTFLSRHPNGESVSNAAAKKASTSGPTAGNPFAKRPAGNPVNPFARASKSQKL
ncbi:hypothetical protein WJX84_006627 [Apatococcus fuscideae]|uniref:Minichromosome loss protein Mcl1 middle region domain-containing protein n=1 Tax=Apatococcus fuscideae TaxID=2026836 RepID=A0AAW1TF25_9CHLO